MSLITADFPSGSQGLYGTQKARMLEGLYAQIGNTFTADQGNCALVTDPDGVSGGVVFRCNENSYGGGGNHITMRETLPAGSTTTVFMACRMYLSALPQIASEQPIPCKWKDGSNSTIMEAIVTTTGVIEVYNHAGTLVGTTSVPVVTAGSWWHIEGMLTCDTGGSGEVKIWVEGIEKASITALTTSATGTSQIERGVDPDGTSSNPAVYFKDTALQDSAGSVNNSQIGPLPVLDLGVVSDVSSGWTSTGANDYGVLDEVPPNDADYIDADDTLPAPSIMELSDLPPDIVGVRGLITYARAWKTDSGDGNLQVGLSPDDGASWDDGADRPITTSATYFRDVSELSPDTGVAWTPVEVDNARIRLDRTL